jgi:hypothetical protein
MANKQLISTNKLSVWMLDFLFALPWIEILAEIWKLLRQLWQGLADEGLYEVLEYDSVLELMDNHGKKARFQKRERVRYRQNNIIAYQDHAWGDGEILIDYRCTPGIVVDQYRPGQKTFLLISLRGAKRRGEIDEFHIEWEQRDGFVRNEELWETEIRHRTKQIRIRIIFPKIRPPRSLWIVEQLRRRKRQLGPQAIRRLPDGRWLASWRCERPRLNERYQLHWEW